MEKGKKKKKMPRKKELKPSEEKGKAFWIRHYREQRRRRQAEERAQRRWNLVNKRWIELYNKEGREMPEQLLVEGDDKR